MTTLDELADLMIEIKPDSMSVIERVDSGVKMKIVYEDDLEEHKHLMFLTNELLEQELDVVKQFIMRKLKQK